MRGKVWSGRSRLGLVLVLLVRSRVPRQCRHSGSAWPASSWATSPARSAVLWTRADRAATLNVTLSGGHGPVPRAQVVAEDDFTGRVPLTRLRPGTTYDYRVWFSLGAPGRGHGRPWWIVQDCSSRRRPGGGQLAFGDVAGQNVCRDAQEGFPIMDTIRAWQPDVFVGLGDMIYADNACETTGRYGNPQLGGVGIAVDQPSFWAHGATTVAIRHPNGCSPARATSARGTTTRS